MTDILIGHDNHFSIYILKYHIVYLKYVQYNVIKNQLEYFINKIKETNLALPILDTPPLKKEILC